MGSDRQRTINEPATSTNQKESTSNPINCEIEFSEINTDSFIKNIEVESG